MAKKVKTGINIVPIRTMIVHANDSVNICYEASKSCVAGKLLYDEDSRTTYIGKRVKDTDESILEHSNVIMVCTIPMEHADSLSVFLANCRYLRCRVKLSASKQFVLLIGGSIRGYKNAIRESYDQNNVVLSKVKTALTQCVPACFMIDLIYSGIYKFSDFSADIYKYLNCLTPAITNVLDDGTEYVHHMNTIPCEYPDTFIDFINVDPVEDILKKVEPFGFSLLEVIDVCSVTIKFCNMSRIITQQLTRHRNAITQESQRYVSSAGATFNTPDQFKPDRYQADHIYGIDLKYPDIDEAIHMDLTMSDLSKVLIPIYEQLVNQGMLKEDARYFLPQNTHSTVYMTFTVKSLFEFLNLRCDAHAQAEIRKYANAIRDTFFFKYWYKVFGAEYYADTPMDTISRYLTPKYMYSEVFSDTSDTEEAIGPEESITIEREHSVATPDIIGDDDIATDFGMRNDKPAAMDKSDKAVEEMYRTYNPATYADTRLDEKEV